MNISPKEELDFSIKVAVADGVVSVEEYDHILKLAEEAHLTTTDVDLMVQDAFREHFKDLITKYASDGKIDSNEMVALKKRGQQIGITEDDMLVLITESLSEYKEAAKRNVINTFITIGTLATTLVAGAGALLLLRAPQKKEQHLSNITNNYCR